jgi:hypothetical protein
MLDTFFLKIALLRYIGLWETPLTGEGAGNCPTETSACRLKTVSLAECVIPGPSSVIWKHHFSGCRFPLCVRFFLWVPTINLNRAPTPSSSLDIVPRLDSQERPSALRGSRNSFVQALNGSGFYRLGHWLKRTMTWPELHKVKYHCQDLAGDRCSSRG